MPLIEPTKLKSRTVVLRDHGTGSHHFVIREAIAGVRTPGPDGGVRYHPGAPLLYVAACDGKALEVANRVVHLINKYGLTEE